jgi:hypothetical protein
MLLLSNNNQSDMLLDSLDALLSRRVLEAGCIRLQSYGSRRNYKRLCGLEFTGKILYPETAGEDG